MKFNIGQTVGDYEIVGVLDASQAGYVYKVRNVLAQRLELLKVFPKEFQDDQEHVDRFLREIKIHARLSHPNIAAFYTATQLEGQFVMTTELLDGVTLAHRLESGPLPWQEAAGLIRQALAALAYAQEHGVVHRMIAPANFVITPDGTVKLTGFDLAKAPADPALTKVGVVMGSIEYMSPEQVKGLPDLDGRSDIYSLGAVFYAMVTGRPPFESRSQFEIMAAHVNATPAPPSSVRTDVPPELDRVILKALAKEPFQRYQTAKEFQEALDAIVPAPAEGAAKAAPALPPLERPSSPEPAFAEPFPALAPPPPAAPRGLSAELIALGAFTFLIVAAAFFAILTFSRH